MHVGPGSLIQYPLLFDNWCKQGSMLMMDTSLSILETLMQTEQSHV